MSKKTPITADAVKRIQRTETINNDGKVAKDSFTSRAQRALDTANAKKPA